MVVICAEAADAIATPPSAEAPARNSRLESPGVAVPFILPPCASSHGEGYAAQSSAEFSCGLALVSTPGEMRCALRQSLLVAGVLGVIVATATAALGAAQADRIRDRRG